MKIYKATISKEYLGCLPNEERTFFFSIAHLANEINMLLRFTLWADQTPKVNKAEANANVAITFMFIKLLAGKLNEGYILLQTRYFNSISRLYDANLQQEGRDALDNIKRYFSRGDALVHSIRNNFAFHYSPDKFDKVFPDIPEAFEFYVESEGSANNLFYFAEALVNRAILREIGESDDFIAYKKLITEVPKVANWFSSFCRALMFEFISRYKNGMWEDEAEEIHFDSLPDIEEIKLPWFVNPSQAYKKHDTMK